MANRELTAKIKTAFEESGETYGSPRIYQVMRKLGLMCSKNRVARLMRAEGLCAKQARRRRFTTKRNKSHPTAPNRLNGDFSAERPNQKWLVDITYISTLEGWLYLAVVLDLFSRRIVGWAMSSRMTSDLTLRALDMAIRRCRPEPGLTHHSDQGSQYTDGDYQAVLTAHDMLASMNGVGSWYDNAPMESFFGTLKSELVYLTFPRESGPEDKPVSGCGIILSEGYDDQSKTDVQPRVQAGSGAARGNERQEHGPDRTGSGHRRGLHPAVEKETGGQWRERLSRSWQSTT